MGRQKSRHRAGCAPLLPLVGRTDSAEGRARRGAPGMAHLADEGLKVCQPRGPGLAEWLGLALRLMHGGPASTDSPMPGALLLARPSAESVLPHKGGGELPAGFVRFRSPLEGQGNCIWKFLIPLLRRQGLLDSELALDPRARFQDSIFARPFAPNAIALPQGGRGRAQPPCSPRSARSFAISARSSGTPAPARLEVGRMSGNAAGCLAMAAAVSPTRRSSSSGFNASALVRTT